MILNYRQIIASSWAFTQKNKWLIIWYSFIPSVLTTLVSIVYVIYQYFAFKNSELFANEHSASFLKKVLVTSFEFVKDQSSLGLVIVGVIIILVLLYLLLPTLCHGSLIQLTARLQNHQNVKLGDGLYFGLMSFLPLFEYHLLVKGFSLVGIFTELSFIIRNLGVEWFKLLLGVFGLIGIVGLILSALFIYTEYFIVIDKEKVFPSIFKSTRLVLRHWQDTLLILIIMAIISLQIIIRVAMVILIPVIVTFSTAYLVQFTLLKQVGFLIGLFLGLISLLFAAYLAGTVNVFATSVWVKTFLELSSKEESSARDENVKVLQNKELSAREIAG